MLAAHAEEMSPKLRELAVASRSLYPEFTTALTHSTGIDPYYISSSDFLIPRLHGEQITDPSSPYWLRGENLAAAEPLLGPSVIAAKRIPSDGHIDNRRLMAALRAACDKLGVIIRDTAPAKRLVVSPDTNRVDGVITSEGDTVKAGHVVLAAGAWSRSLLSPLPVRPVKGQMISLRAPDAHEHVPRYVLHGKNAYIVPKEDGRTFYVGATVEDGTFDVANTAAGMSKLLNAAIEYVPAMSDYTFKEAWSGLRPATPDLMPVLGMSEFENMSIATGYYRNGVLLTPVTAKIAAAVALGETKNLPHELLTLIPYFSMTRFLGNEAQATPTPKASPIHSSSTVPLGSATISPPKQDLGSTANPVLVWRVLPDGTKEPVKPPNLRQADKKSKSQEPDSESTTVLSSHMTPQEYQPETQPPSQRESSVTKTMTTSSDAYDDIMQYRNDAERIMDEALAANRAFGREESSLEKENGKVLSLSEDEMRSLDKAAEEGFSDFKEIESCFDDNHPSVLASRAEVMTSTQNPTNNTHGVNGRPAQLHNAEGNTDGTTAQPGGYY